MFLFAV